MSSEVVVRLQGLGKSYRVYARPVDRLLQMMPWNKNRQLYREYHALQGVDLQINRGDVIGLVGQNGAGKSTVLQIICGTLEASSGEVFASGKIAALLELGSGFNPEFTGRENVYMSAAIGGMERSEIESKFEGIVDFSGIRDFIDQPVKTYSSGMLVRLAFAVATSVDPDLLVIDEALSVGDGAFARKSFDRIMSLKQRGCTIIFCSHSLYQVEVLCNKVAWLEHGRLKAFGEPAGVINAYQRTLDGVETVSQGVSETCAANQPNASSGSGRIVSVRSFTDDGQEGDLNIITDQSDVSVEIHFIIDTALPRPTIGVLITDDQLKNITSNGSLYDGYPVQVDANGNGRACLTYTKFGLRQGSYYVHAFLMCENAIHIYDSVQASVIHVTQTGSELGIVSLPKSWS